MSGSARTTTTAVPHRGRLYAPRRPPPAPAPIPRAGGRYGGLRDEVPRGDVEWDVGEGEDLDLGPGPGGVRHQPAAWCTTGGR